MKISTNDKCILIYTIATMLCLVSFKYVLFPAKTEMQQTRNLISQKQQELSLYRRNTEQGQNYKDKVKQLSDLLVNKVGLRRAESSFKKLDVLSHLEEIAIENNVKLTSKQVLDGRKKNNLFFLPVQLECVGTNSEIFSYIYKLTNDSEPFSITSFRIERNGEAGNSLRAQIMLEKIYDAGGIHLD